MKIHFDESLENSYETQFFFAYKKSNLQEQRSPAPLAGKMQKKKILVKIFLVHDRDNFKFFFSKFLFFCAKMENYFSVRDRENFQWLSGHNSNILKSMTARFSNFL